MPSGAYDKAGITAHILPKTLAYIGKNGEKRPIRWCNWLRIYKKELLDKNDIHFDRRFRRSQDLQLTYEATLAAENYYYLGDDYLYHNRVVDDSLSRGYTKNMWYYYKILIEHLYDVTRKTGDEELMRQMHLRAFFFVTDCIENEMKKSCPHDRQRSIEIIDEIINDDACKRFEGKIPIDKMNARCQQYYQLIFEKKAESFFAVTEEYNRKMEKLRKKNQHKAKWIYFLTESKVLGGIYKKIRNR
jgi:hypothetical protein